MTHAVVFDVYGTLLDVDSATSAAAAEEGMEDFAPVAGDLSARWRQRQLAMTWQRSLMGDYADFWTVTQAALDATLEEMGLAGPALRERLLELYLRLSAYGEVKPELEALRGAGHRLGVLSNGNPAMLEAALCCRFGQRRANRSSSWVLEKSSTPWKRFTRTAWPLEFWGWGMSFPSLKKLKRPFLRNRPQRFSAKCRATR